MSRTFAPPRIPGGLYVDYSYNFHSSTSCYIRKSVRACAWNNMGGAPAATFMSPRWK
ncbi:hypothetical protein IF1G_09146 [Cordyceps javanica]|uniref:Uncharacterized protein n=1 Tax=Cordyceps javanica TaxID=43265 RepID=A0A545URI2_9HYPO|nr:hypothetical protein IF1G_09146 [Cordyceps javanica]